MLICYPKALLYRHRLSSERCNPQLLEELLPSCPSPSTLSSRGRQLPLTRSTASGSPTGRGCGSREESISALLRHRTGKNPEVPTARSGSRAGPLVMRGGSVPSLISLLINLLCSRRACAISNCISFEGMLKCRLGRGGAQSLGATVSSKDYQRNSILRIANSRKQLQ